MMSTAAASEAVVLWVPGLVRIGEVGDGDSAGASLAGPKKLTHVGAAVTDGGSKEVRDGGGRLGA